MHEPTEEQRLIIEAARRTQDNLLVNALAGAAKTSTLEMVCHAVTNIPILSLAFNKRIADEMSKRLPGHVEVRTLNALGHRVWAAACGRRLVVDSNKMRGILRAVIDEMPKGARRDEAFEEFSDTLRLISKAKRDGYVPPQWNGPCKPVFGEEWWLDCDESSLQNNLITETLKRSIIAAYEGGIDFDDQIYMPVCFGGTWPKFPLILVDEAQDLNELQHEMLARLVAKRLIAVGDPWQSIYAFRGAKQNGMAAMRERWNMRELTLSVTFRVPRLGVERAWSRVPHMKWREGAPDGEITHLDTWSSDDIPDHAAIVCRNNAPLLSLGFKLLRAGRAIKLVGFDIGAGLVRVLKKLGPANLDPQGIERAIGAWAESALRRAKNPDTVYDRADCLRALCEGRRSLQEAITYAENLFKQEGPIQLLSGHKAKGLEWPVVVHLDAWRIPSKFAKPGTEAYEQELNVKYVIESRFKERLVLANLEGWQE